MKPGLGSLLLGVAVLVAGIVVTVTSKNTVWYGAFIVGPIWIISGVYRMLKGAPETK